MNFSVFDASNPFAALGSFVGGKAFYSFHAPRCAASSRGFEGIFKSSYLTPKNGTSRSLETASNPFASLGSFVGGKAFYSFHAPRCAASSRGFEGIFKSSYLTPKNDTC